MLPCTPSVNRFGFLEATR